ncbi:MAG: hypothetical protein H7A26_02970 [Spirochaetales bacterium]|nr:hypothetical protein [Spirochaetales bacterium]
MFSASHYYLIPSLAVILLIISSGCKTQPVLKEKELPPPPEEKIEAVITYRVEPSKFHTDEYGYTGAGYLTRDQQWEKIKTALDKKNASADLIKKENSKLPKTGTITIHIGRLELMHADTVWYTIAGKEKNKTIFTIKGKEGVPNIKGRDGNWWNTIEIPLHEEISSRIDITVTDRKTGREYNFSIIKETS